jgi:hypothetical protein
LARSTTLFQLKSDRGSAFDGSTSGISVLNSVNVKALPEEAGFALDKGFLSLAPHAKLMALQSFSFETIVTPQKLSGQNQTVFESRSPAVSLSIDPKGRLIGSLKTAAGWFNVDSGETRIEEGTEAQIQLTRSEAGLTTLKVNQKTVGSKAINGALVSTGPQGIRIGASWAGKNQHFSGSVSQFEILSAPLTAEMKAHKLEAASQIAGAFKGKTGIDKVSVSLLDDPSRSRLQAIRDILTAAGVDALSDLSTLQLKVPTVMTPGRVIVAGRGRTKATIDWSRAAREISEASDDGKRAKLAQLLTNRNSLNVLGARGPKSQPAPAGTVASHLPQLATIHSSGPRASGSQANLEVQPVPRTPTANKIDYPVEIRQANLSLRSGLAAPNLADLVKVDNGKVSLIDAESANRFEQLNPALWPILIDDPVKILTLKTIPVNSAVIIAQTLDLTDTELLVEPAVTKLYIIAEEVICGSNAQITWRQPGGDTPSRLDDPGLDGRGWSGVQTKDGSRDGLDGLDGQSGTTGISGAQGANSPALEIWVKALTAIPNLDLDGEAGRTGGRGQRGGVGGHGGDGHVGERVWFFTWICTSDPGDGGDGGNGGPGGVGGAGGKGGNGGDITIGVLEGTLAATVTNKSFKIKNQGGQPGEGSDGGDGGAGGTGGRSGAGDTCHDARAGHNGAQGQPGARGSDNPNPGMDGDISFFEFTQEAWDEMLTRPWVSQINPTECFPGDQITLTGSRFTTADTVMVDSSALVPTVNADETISVLIPMSIEGGQKSVYLRRPDGTESNRLAVWIKPQLDAFSTPLAADLDVTLSGHAFLADASVLIDGSAIPSKSVTRTSITFTTPGTAGTGSAGGTVTVQVRNADGRVSNSRTATKPHILEIPFTWGTNNLSFNNFSDGVPSWGTFEQTFGAVEVWHELLDPIFGHPLLTTAFFLFYEYFLKGTANGGLATGFCTSLASTVADKLWTGALDTHTLTKDELHEFLTAVHGKLLSRQSLIHFHAEGREGVVRVEESAREVEATFLRGTSRQNAPLIFFIPSGEVWDSGYFDKLGESHCVMPYRFVYPPGHAGPQLSADGSKTVDDLDGVKLYVWDCNHAEDDNCRLEFSKDASGVLQFQYIPDGSTEFSSSDGITLGMMTNGDYLLADHDMPFSGPFGLTSFIIDFLLSPADLQVTDGLGLRTGNFGGQLLSEIPNSHPCYLMKGMYMLPTDTAMTRRIVGNGQGSYTYNSIMPGIGSLVIQNVQTGPGQEDVLAVNSDGTQIRFSPGTQKTFNVTIAKQVGGQARAIAINGVGAAPGAEMDLTIAPDLSVIRIGNRDVARTVDVSAFAIAEGDATGINRAVIGLQLPSQHDLVVVIPDWNQVNLSAQALSFE